MKKFTILLTVILMSLSLLAQAPAGINYQTIIRDGAGDILPDTELTLQMTIRSGAPDGAVVYQENHEVTTNAFGLVNLVIGSGTALSGSFGAVEWGKNSHYLETAIELAGSKQFQVMGVTQFLSVPYAQFSGYTGSVLSMTSQERNALQNPLVGMQIYNISTNCLNYYNGSEWFETCGNLVENFPPDVPIYLNPPDGATDLPFVVWFNWSCTDPEGDPLEYDFYFGTNNPPPLSFTTNGTAWGSYPLEHSSTYFWKVVARDDHDNATEGPVWSFQTINCFAPEVFAGEDAVICQDDSYQIADATIGTSATLIGWTTSGDGTFSDPSALNPVYTPGLSDIAIGHVVLSLSASTNSPCPPLQASDEMMLSFQPLPTVNAGQDLTLCYGGPVLLNANALNFSAVQWFTINGLGYIENEYQLNATYIPSYMDLFLEYLEFYIYAAPISPCTIGAEDWLNITLGEAPPANAGPDQLNLPGTTATLAGNIPPSGSFGYWYINSGAGGSIAQPNNPTSTFTGIAGNSYSLKWKVYSAFGCNAEDLVTVSFASNWACGQSFTDTRDGKVYTTLQIGTQCWMKQNLNIGTRIAGTSNQTNNGTIEKYCYNNTESNCTTYGGLYQWDEMMQYTTTAGVKGICPTGWHLPTDAEWTTLTTYVSSQTANRCNSNVDYIAKSMAATTNWNTSTNTCAVGNNLAANNSTGFTGLPGGSRDTDGTFASLGNGGYFWYSSQTSATYAWNRTLGYLYTYVGRGNDTKGYGFSVRCLRD